MYGRGGGRDIVRMGVRKSVKKNGRKSVWSWLECV